MELGKEKPAFHCDSVQRPLPLPLALFRRSILQVTADWYNKTLFRVSLPDKTSPHDAHNSSHSTPSHPLSPDPTPLYPSFPPPPYPSLNFLVFCFALLVGACSPLFDKFDSANDPCTYIFHSSEALAEQATSKPRQTEWATRQIHEERATERSWRNSTWLDTPRKKGRKKAQTHDQKKDKPIY